MDSRDRIFDLLVEISDFAHEDGLTLVSRKLEETLDVFLAETGKVPGSEASKQFGRRPRRYLAKVRPASRKVQERPLGQFVSQR